MSTRKREHSRKPDELFDIVEACSPGPYLELFARFPRDGWDTWGNENVEQNHSNGVALRKGHVEPTLRLTEPPRNYRGGIREEKVVVPDPSFEQIAIRRAS